MTALRIVGIGSHVGDDRLGWMAVDALRGVPMPADTELHTIASPATELLPLLQGAQRVILVDAVACEDRAGSVVRCNPRDLERRGAAVSGHGLSVDMALDLAAALGELPAEVLLIGLAVDPSASLPGGRMTRAVSRALPTLVAEVAKAAYTEAVPA
jgi:hydrogenase maturation protease